MQFDECAANKDDLTSSLGNYKGPLVLCIDELRPELPNEATSQQKALWSFLTTYFLRENRLLIFSAHDRSTVVRLSDMKWMTGSGSEIKVQRLPRIRTDRAEDMRFLDQYRITPSCVGLSLLNLSIISRFLIKRKKSPLTQSPIR